MASSMLDMTLDDVIAARKKEEKEAKKDGSAMKEDEDNDAGAEEEEGDDEDMEEDQGEDEDEEDDDEDEDAAMEGAEDGVEGVGGPGAGGGKATYNKSGRNARRHAPYRKNGGRGGGVPSNAMYMNDDGSERSRRVYVGNLSWDVSWRELKDHMKSTGCEVTHADVLTTHDGRSKGCGIVEFATAEGAKKAVLTLNDTELMGRQIFVREDREEAAGGGGTAHDRGHHYQHHHRGHGGRFSAGGDAQTRRCYVGNLSWDVAWQDLKDHMRQAGDVVFAEVMTESDGRSKGCGIVEYATADEAQEAIKTLTDTELKGRMVFVREDREISSGPRQSTSVYVGNLAYETSWQDLKDHMRAAGNVDQANILTGEDGRSKGCGIVQYQRPHDAARAIRELQNSVLHDRPIFVREDREQGGGGGGGGRGGYSAGYGGGGGGDKDVGCQLFVGNLSYETTWKELKDHFRQCGDVERADVMESADGRKKGYGTVRFVRAKDAKAAISRLNGVELMGRPLEVRVDHKAH